MNSRASHLVEYAIEAVCLGLFLVSAAGFTALLQHPASPAAAWLSSPLERRMVMGAAMGLTAALIIYSPLGHRSGAHMNPAVTLAFMRLGKIASRDAAGYVLGQFAGGVAGIALAARLFAPLVSDPAVNYAATVPGDGGIATAFVAEAAISFVMMLAILSISSVPAFARLTGVLAAVLVATFIVTESPLSGMSMNPARTFGPALFAHTADSLWLYFTAPLLGMLAAAETFARVVGLAPVRCAKLDHRPHVRCIFRCGYMETPA